MQLSGGLSVGEVILNYMGKINWYQTTTKTDNMQTMCTVFWEH